MSKYHIDLYLSKLNYIHTQCAPARAKKEEEEALKKMDKFTRLKKDIAEDVREVKRMIKERDALGDDRAATAEKSSQIRSKIRSIKEDIEELSQLQKKRQKKVENKKNPDEEELEKVQNEKEIVNLAWQHVAECEKLERFGENHEHNDLFDSETSDDKYVGGIPDIDDPQFEELRMIDKQIDDNLDEILIGVNHLKNIAQDIGSEIDRQNEIISNIEDQTDRVRSNLGGVNERLKSVLRKVRGPREFFCDCLCCLLILGIAACIFYLLS